MGRLGSRSANRQRKHPQDSSKDRISASKQEGNQMSPTSRAQMAKLGRTIDPTQITGASEIPPPGADFAGLSSQGLVDVYYGTLLGDTDAPPAAKELLGTALDTGGLSNADYIYNQVSALYGGVQLPDFQSPSGNGNNVKSLVFISGSGQCGYGPFHLPLPHADFLRLALHNLH